MVVGASGSGKSTLPHCLAGLDNVDTGTAVLDDVDLSKLGDRKLTRLRRDLPLRLAGRDRRRCRRRRAARVAGPTRLNMREAMVNE